MKPTRSRQVISWLIVATAISLSALVTEEFFVFIVLLLYVRPDLLEKEASDQMVAHYKKLSLFSAGYAAVCSLFLLAVTLLKDSALVSSMGLRVLFIVMWPLILIVCLNEYRLFMGGTTDTLTANQRFIPTGPPQSDQRLKSSLVSIIGAAGRPAVTGMETL